MGTHTQREEADSFATLRNGNAEGAIGVGSFPPFAMMLRRWGTRTYVVVEEETDSFATLRNGNAEGGMEMLKG